MQGTVTVFFLHLIEPFSEFQNYKPLFHPRMSDKEAYDIVLAIAQNGYQIEEYIDSKFTPARRRSGSQYYVAVRSAAKRMIDQKHIQEGIYTRIVDHCNSRIPQVDIELEQDRQHAAFEQKLSELTASNLELQNTLTPLLIRDTSLQDQRIKDQNSIIKWGTLITAIATIGGAIVGAKLTQNSTSSQADTTALPSTQIAPDTVRVIVHDTLYLPDSLRP